MKYARIIRPITTEKSTRLSESKQYTLWVSSKTTKIDVKRAFIEMYGEKPVSVNMMNVVKKVRMIGKGRVMTKRPLMKKAIVKVNSKKGIDINKLKLED
ncbi:MAG: 50S ribosomal protein L23 [Candidatus Gracilibacteria bacterium]|jgi:ribosomal protein L23